MTFISLQFVVFFVIVTALYFIIPHKVRWVLLLLAGCLFYISFIPKYILVLFFLIAVDYISGFLIENSRRRFFKVSLLTISILSTIGVLFIFKYFNFFTVNLRQVATFFGWNYSPSVLKLVLPIGLSFHTFQSLAYVIEVYRGRQKAERNIGIYALYVMFFPQLMAGPIERPYNMLHQFREEHRFEYERVVSGLRLMLWGAFQKVVIADQAAKVVNLVYDDPSTYVGFPLVVATVLFSFQIFCDFAGYSNIAIGTARVLGFKLMKNFNSPYLATSIKDFWRRWHISLSSWFRDYFYIPLGGNRVIFPRRIFNIMATFVVSGLWHGANWTFVIWGGLHGLYFLIFDLFGLLIKRFRSFAVGTLGRLSKFLGIGATFVLVTFAWVFFRAEDLGDALYIVHYLIQINPSVVFKINFATILSLVAGKGKILGLTTFSWLILVGAILIMAVVHMIQEKRSVTQIINKKPIFVRWVIYYCLVLLVIFYAAQGREQFIYFQF